jgi:ribA/ribD-fused uncharacterized protein
MFKYELSEVISFRKTTEQFGGLSNMATGYPLFVNDIQFSTSEALYQACKFPDYPDIQSIILKESSPMAAKMKIKPFKAKIRKDWLNIRVGIMEWCLSVKLYQHPNGFGNLLLSTGGKSIVEDSWRDTFWGAKLRDGYFEGHNILGTLLMRMRDFWIENHNKQLRNFLSPPKVVDAYLLGRQINNVKYYVELEQKGEAIRQERELKAKKPIPRGHDQRQVGELKVRKPPPNYSQMNLLAFCSPGIKK